MMSALKGLVLTLAISQSVYLRMSLASSQARIDAPSDCASSRTPVVPPVASSQRVGDVRGSLQKVRAKRDLPAPVGANSSIFSRRTLSVSSVPGSEVGTVSRGEWVGGEGVAIKGVLLKLQ